MNYLAHAYLSFNDPGILTGNMISDFVKGKKKYDYPLNVQKGIQLHRAIDEFTDNHSATKEAKEFFRKDYRLYAGAFVDIVYDHFLAKDEAEFVDEAALKLFSAKTYSYLHKYKAVFPERFTMFFYYMEKEDWLYNYSHVKFIEQSFAGLVKRSAYLTESAMAGIAFAQHYHSLEDCYNYFFKSLKIFAFNRFQQLLKI